MSGSNRGTRLFTTRPEILGTFGVVTSTHWLASAIGMAILEKGGNAFDAAAGVGFVLQIVEPNRNGPGGEVPILLCESQTRNVFAICGQGVMPATATAERFRNLGLALIPGTGLLPACVPGQFDAWMILLREWGTLSLREVLSYAIELARNGHPIAPRVCDTIAASRTWFAEHWPDSAALYLPGSKVPEAGTLFKNRPLADTYDRIVREAESVGGNRAEQIEKARETWSKGFVAEEIDKFCRENEFMDETGARNGGLITGQDMARWSATIEEPLGYQYHDYTVFKVGAWSQSPVFLQQLAILRNFDLDKMNPLRAEFIHTVVEAAKLCYADRETFYGDPNFVDVPMETLLSDEYNRNRKELICDRSSYELIPGRIPGYGGAVQFKTIEELSQAGALSSPIAGGDTCHFDIIDKAGNMVSATPSGGWLHRSPVIPTLGFGLGTRGQMFWLEEGLPGSLAPGKRPRTTLSPNIAFKDGDPYLAFGTPGADKQDQWSLTLFLRHVHHGFGLQEAIEAPQFYTEHFPGSFYPRASRPGHLCLEGGTPLDTIEELRRRGHRVELSDDWSQGRFAAAARENGILRAAANPRFMEGYAAGR